MEIFRNYREFLDSEINRYSELTAESPEDAQRLSTEAIGMSTQPTEAIVIDYNRAKGEPPGKQAARYVSSARRGGAPPMPDEPDLYELHGADTATQWITGGESDEISRAIAGPSVREALFNASAGISRSLEEMNNIKDGNIVFDVNKDIRYPVATRRDVAEIKKSVMDEIAAVGEGAPEWYGVYPANGSYFLLKDANIQKDEPYSDFKRRKPAEALEYVRATPQFILNSLADKPVSYYGNYGSWNPQYQNNAQTFALPDLFIDAKQKFVNAVGGDPATQKKALDAAEAYFMFGPDFKPEVIKKYAMNNGIPDNKFSKYVGGTKAALVGDKNLAETVINFWKWWQGVEKSQKTDFPMDIIGADFIDTQRIIASENIKRNPEAIMKKYNLPVAAYGDGPGMAVFAEKPEWRQQGLELRVDYGDGHFRAATDVMDGINNDVYAEILDIGGGRANISIKNHKAGYYDEVQGDVLGKVGDYYIIGVENEVLNSGGYDVVKLREDQGELLKLDEVNKEMSPEQNNAASILENIGNKLAADYGDKIYIDSDSGHPFIEGPGGTSGSFSALVFRTAKALYPAFFAELDDDWIQWQADIIASNTYPKYVPLFDNDE